MAECNRCGRDGYESYDERHREYVTLCSLCEACEYVCIGCGVDRRDRPEGQCECPKMEYVSEEEKRDQQLRDLDNDIARKLLRKKWKD
jgi:hypothetical protein